MLQIKPPADKLSKVWSTEWYAPGIWLINFADDYLDMFSSHPNR